MSVDVKYSVSATATGGRDGHAKTDDGEFEVSLAKPTEMGGSGDGNNPEQLFAAGYAACFLGAMQFVSSQGGPATPKDTKVTASVGIGPRSEGGFGLTISLAISTPGLSQEDAEKLVNEAHQVCPYSNATRGNINVELSIV